MTWQEAITHMYNLDKAISALRDAALAESDQNLRETRMARWERASESWDAISAVVSWAEHEGALQEVVWPPTIPIIME